MDAWRKKKCRLAASAKHVTVTASDVTLAVWHFSHFGTNFCQNFAQLHYPLENFRNQIYTNVQIPNKIRQMRTDDNEDDVCR